jgi:ATP-dependent DNA helicase RecQ
VSELETIVSSGTRIDIGYYINQMIDPDRQKEFFEYFRTADTDSPESALAELGENDYSPIDIRLLRIKFLSELGN